MILGLESALEWALEPEKHYLNPIITAGESPMVFAKTGDGKTMVTLYMAISIACGNGCLGFNVDNRRQVLYIDAETSERILAKRVNLFITEENKLKVGQNFHYIGRKSKKITGLEIPYIASIAVKIAWQAC